MIKTRITYEGRKVTFYDTSPQAGQMFNIARVGVESIKARVARAVGSDDAAMKPLKLRRRQRWSKSQQRMVEYGQPNSGWGRIKTRKGLKPIRDLMGTGEDGGHMLDSLRVVSASPVRAVIDISGAKARVKARANERRAAWYGFSGSDVKNLIDATTRIWRGNVDAFTAQFKRGAMTPRWMDPLGLQGGATASRTRAGEIARGYRAMLRGAA